MKVLSSHKFVLLFPDNLDFSSIKNLIDVSSCDIKFVSGDWLGKKKGVEGYNKMMMSKYFYKLFSDTEYILICQTDAFIFRDELIDWCNAGYDYIGAPWVNKDFYSSFYVKAYLWAFKFLRGSKTTILRQDLFNKVGNGGLSLRKVDRCIEACKLNKRIIKKFAMRKHNLYNEDVFWALIPSDFKYPSVDKALEFSIDSKPDLCFARNKNRTPFGCHGLAHHVSYDFWIKHLNFKK